MVPNVPIGISNGITNNRAITTRATSGSWMGKESDLSRGDDPGSILGVGEKIYYCVFSSIEKL